MAAFENCIEAGGEPHCVSRAVLQKLSNSASKELCVDEEEGGDEEMDACETRCRERANRVHERCLEELGEDGRRDCRERSGAALEECMANACAGDDGEDEEPGDAERQGTAIQDSAALTSNVHRCRR